MLTSDNPLKNLLLASSSTIYSRGYLDHIENDIREQLCGVQRVAFVPFALYDRDAYATKAGGRFHQMGFALESVHSASAPKQLIEEADAIFIGGGNTICWKPFGTELKKEFPSLDQAPVRLSHVQL